MLPRHAIGALGLVVVLLSLSALASSARRAREQAALSEASRPSAPVRPARPAAPQPALEALREGEGVDINSAAAGELELLPGIGPRLAERIVAFRSAHGPLQRIEALTQVSGIGPRTLERLRPLVRVAGAAPVHSAGHKSKNQSAPKVAPK